MELLTQAKIDEAIKVEVGSERPLPATQSKIVSCLPDPPEPERQRKIIALILEVELVKMLNPPLTKQQRTALMLMLADTGKSLEEIAEMGKRVTKRKTFGTIAFEHWVAEDESNVKANFNCQYCGTEWWGPPNSKCPNCFGV